MLPYYIVYLSIINSTLSSYVYIRDTLKGETKPNRVSWFIWAIAPLIASFLLFFETKSFAALPLFVSGFSSFLIFLASFKNKNAYWQLGKLDYVCLFFALCSLVAWLGFDEGFLATLFAILVDLIAFVPTYVKSWNFPDSENLAPYLSGIFNSLLSLLTITTFTFLTYGFAFYFLLGCVVEILIVLYRKRNLLKYKYAEKI